VDENKQFHANVKTTDALMRAKEVGLDLVCFNKPEGNELAFCKIIDFNKWKYETEKKKKKEESKGKKEHKEIQLSPNIEDNDIGHKMRHANKFLDEGHEVTLIMRLRGREKAHMFEAEQKMNKIVQICDEHGKEMSRKKTNDLIIIKLSK
jgi:translation initiation factor IF-3